MRHPSFNRGSIFPQLRVRLCRSPVALLLARTITVVTVWPPIIATGTQAITIGPRRQRHPLPPYFPMMCDRPSRLLQLYRQQQQLWPCLPSLLTTLQIHHHLHIIHQIHCPLLPMRRIQHMETLQLSQWLLRARMPPTTILLRIASRITAVVVQWVVLGVWLWPLF